jgi:hypothetical protein
MPLLPPSQNNCTTSHFFKEQNLFFYVWKKTLSTFILPLSRKKHNANFEPGHTAPTFTSVRRHLAPHHWRALQRWTPHVDEPPFVQAARRCCAKSACCKRIFQVFQGFYLDVVKVDLDVAFVAMATHVYVASVCSKCFICFRCMLKLFHLGVTKVDGCWICCNGCVASVCSKYFRRMLQLFNMGVAKVWSCCCSSSMVAAGLPWWMTIGSSRRGPPMTTTWSPTGGGWTPAGAWEAW